MGPAGSNESPWGSGMGAPAGCRSVPSPGLLLGMRIQTHTCEHTYIQSHTCEHTYIQSHVCEQCGAVVVDSSVCATLLSGTAVVLGVTKPCLAAGCRRESLTRQHCPAGRGCGVPGHHCLPKTPPKPGVGVQSNVVPLSRSQQQLSGAFAQGWRKDFFLHIKGKLT